VAKLVDAKAVVDYFKVHYRTVVKNARTGRWPCYHVGRYVRFDLDELKRHFKGE
jgi:excisionase family DNA binding protein